MGEFSACPRQLVGRKLAQRRVDSTTHPGMTARLIENLGPRAAEGVKREESMTTEQVRQLLRRRFASPEWALLEEVAPATGGGTGYADAVAMNLWRSRGHVVYGFEIKVSRSDWQRELKKPAKAESVFQYCDGWYVVALPGVVRDGELPAAWGILEVHGGKLVEKVKPPKLAPTPLDRPFVASLVRRGFELLDHLSEGKQRQAIAEARAQIDQRVAEEVGVRTRKHERLQEAVKSWEAATGLTFDNYAGPSTRIIRVAQILEEIQMRRSTSRADNGFEFLAKLADDLRSASETVRNALSAFSAPDGHCSPTTQSSRLPHVPDDGGARS